MENPLIMKRGTAISDVARKINRRWEGNIKYAKVWGSSKFPGQALGADYRLKDRDVVELHL